MEQARGWQENDDEEALYREIIEPVKEERKVEEGKSSGRREPPRSSW